MAGLKDIVDMYKDCPTCLGEGTLPLFIFGKYLSDICSTCKGKGKLLTAEELNDLQKFQQLLFERS